MLAVGAARAAGDDDPRIFRGDGHSAFRDPAAVWHAGVFHLFSTWVEIEPDGQVFSYCATSRSRDLRTWTPPRKLTPRDNARDFGSPGSVVRDGTDWVLCLQTYPRPGNVFDGKPRYGNADARLWTMRSCDLETWRAPELLRVKGPDVPVGDMGRMIDPCLVRDDAACGGASTSRTARAVRGAAICTRGNSSGGRMRAKTSASCGTAGCGGCTIPPRTASG